MSTHVSNSNNEFACKSYTVNIKHKWATVCSIEAITANQNGSIACTGRHLNIDSCHFYKWKSFSKEKWNAQSERSVTDEVTEISDTGESSVSIRASVASVAPVASCKNMCCRHIWSLHPDMVSILATHETALLQFIIEHRKQGFQLTTRMVRKFAEGIMSEFQGIHRETRNQAVGHIFHRVGLTHHVVTHVVQKTPCESEVASKEFMEFMNCRVKNMNLDHASNMNQTPIPFAFHTNCTWPEKGMHTILVCGSIPDKEGNPCCHY